MLKITAMALLSHLLLLLKEFLSNSSEHLVSELLLSEVLCFIHWFEVVDLGLAVK